MTNPKLQAFIDKHMLPGFYIDVTGCYSISDSILNLILDTLHCFEAATKDTLLIVEII